MSTRSFTSIAVRVVVAGACLLTAAGCGSELLRTGRSPVYLVVDSVSTLPGGSGGTPAAFLQSDVQPVFNDTAIVSLRVIPKNPDVGPTDINSVTLTRYHVEYRRTDGRNTPGVDVPFAIDGGVSVTINVGGAGDAAIILVRNQAKLEPPLMNLRALGGQVVISTIAEVTLYGRDQNGNEVAVIAHIDVHFADYADAA